MNGGAAMALSATALTALYIVNNGLPPTESRKMKPLSCAAAVALFAFTPPAAHAVPTILVGNYGPGDYVAFNDSIELGPGNYRFRFELSSAPEFFDGWITKTINYNDYCDLDGTGSLGFCGGNDYPSERTLNPLTPFLYEANVSVKAPYSEYYAGGSRSDYTESCCDYHVEFQSQQAGSYVFSFATVPEPSTWALMIIGFGMIGGAMRKAKRGVKLMVS